MKSTPIRQVALWASLLLNLPSCGPQSSNPLPPTPSSFVNFETPHVSPLTMTPDGNLLLAVNTPDNRVELFDLTGDQPVHVGSVPVGLDPVSVRARTDNEVWVANHLSDSVSIIDLNTHNVI